MISKKCFIKPTAFLLMLVMFFSVLGSGPLATKSYAADDLVSVSATFGNPMENNGLEAVSTDEGGFKGVISWVEDRYAMKFPPGPIGGADRGYIYCKTSDDFISNLDSIDESRKGPITVTVEYYDDPALAGAQFELWYSNNGNAWTPRTTLSGSGTWKTANIVLNSFTPRGINGANDFRFTAKAGDMAVSRIVVSKGIVTIDPEDPGDTLQEASYTVGPDKDSGIADHMFLAGFFENEGGKEGTFETIDGKHVYTTQAGAGSDWRYMWFRLDDAFKEIPAGDMTLAVTYYDASTAKNSVFNIWYAGEGVQLESGEVTLTGTDKWKTAYIPLPNCKIRNGLTHGTDFRLTVRRTEGSTGVSFHKIEFFAYPKTAPEEPIEGRSFVTFGAVENETVTENLEWSGHEGQFGTFGMVAGRTAYTIPGSKDWNYIWCRVAKGFQTESAVTVAITYYDGDPDAENKNSRWHLWYRDSEGNDQWTQWYNLGFTGEWKTEKVVLRNVDFDNVSINGNYSFRLANQGGPVSVHEIEVINGEESVDYGDTVDIEFGENVVDTFGISHWTGDYGDGGIFKTAGTPPQWGYEINGAGKNDIYIYLNIDDAFLYGGKNKAEVKVEYYDGAAGNWSIAYDGAATPWVYSDSVSLRGSGQWQTKTFIFEDMAMTNRCNGADIRIEGRNGVIIRSVTVKKIETIIVEAQASREASVFFDTDDVGFDLKYTNETSQEQNLNVSIDVVNPYGASIYNKTETITAPAKQAVNKALNLGRLPKGSYFLNVNVRAGSINVTERYRFGVIKDLTDRQFTFQGWGACAHYGQGQGGIDIIKRLYKQAGVTSIRDEVYWGNVEKSKGVYNIDPNNWVKTLRDEGIRPLLILCYDNPLYRPMYGQEWLEAYGRYAEELARAYKGVVDCFEVWNEFNGTFGNGRPDTYYQLLKYAYEGVKRGNPDAMVVAGGVVGYDDAFIKAVARMGEPGEEGWRYMEAVSYHYPNRDQVTRCAEDIKQAIVDISGGQYEAVMGKPYPEAWITEIGWSTKVPGGVTEVQQAAYVAQLYLELAWSGATEMTHYYDFRNDGVNPAEHEQNFGIVDVTGAPKPAFVALNNLADLINGRIPGEKWTNAGGRANLNINEFKGVGGADDLYVIWSRVGEQSFSLNLGTDDFTVIDSYGNEVPYSSQNGSINITVGELPICVTGKFDSAPVVDNASFTSAQSIVYVTPGEEVSFKINRSGSATALSGKYELQMPLGWTVVSGSEFGPGSQDVITIKVSDDYSAQTGKIVVTAKSMQGDTYATINISTSTVDAFEIEVYPVAKSTGDGWDVAVKLNNNYNKAVIPKGYFKVNNPHQSSGIYTFDEIPPNDYVEILVPAPWLSGDFTTQFDFTIAAGSGSNAIIKNVNRTLSALTAVKADNQITVDGNITADEWDGAMRFVLDSEYTYRHVAGDSWQGPDDLSFEGRVKWDDEYLYLAVEVTDEVHHNVNSPDTWWMGDGVQLCIDPYRSFNSHSNTGFEFFGFALSSASQGTTSYLESNNVQGAAPGEGLLSAVVRDDQNKKTYYEMGFKWSSILPPAVYNKLAAGYTDIGFSMLVNDNDGELRKGWQQYMDGIGYGRNPALWGDLILTDLTSFDAPTPPDPNHPDYWKVPPKPNPPFVPSESMSIVASTPKGGQGSDPEVLFDNNINTRFEDGNQNVHPKFLVIDLGARYDVDEIWYRTQRDYDGGAIFSYSVWVGDSLEGIDILKDFENVRDMSDSDFANLDYLSTWTRVADNAAAPAFIYDEFLQTTETIGEYRLQFPNGAHAKGRYLTLLVHETRYDDWRMATLDVHYIPEPVDKDALAALIDEAEALIESDYTAESWAVFAQALEAAKAVLADENAAQDDVDEALNVLKAAIMALTEKPVVIKAIPTASVKKLPGSQNDLTITVTELYSDGSTKAITTTVKINNNADGIFEVGKYRVYVDTKGNDQIRACYICD